MIESKHAPSTPPLLLQLLFQRTQGSKGRVRIIGLALLVPAILLRTTTAMLAATITTRLAMVAATLTIAVLVATFIVRGVLHCLILSHSGVGLHRRGRRCDGRA